MKYTYDVHPLQTFSIRERQHKTAVVPIHLAHAGDSTTSLISSFPNQLGAKSLRAVSSAIASACHKDKLVVAAFGAHVIKTGCSPFMIDLMERGIIKGLCCHNACAIHDAEMALFGETSEEVGDTIKDGSFGMVKETMDFFQRALRYCEVGGGGFGEAVGMKLQGAPNASNSIFAKAYELDLPITIHAAIGTDTIHASSDIDGAALGRATMMDFRLICNVVADLEDGVWMNIGSAVILPEVFLKAVSVVRNQGIKLDNVTTLNMDMIRHYRPHQNVVCRPFPGKGHEIIGQHEIMIPLLRQAILEELLRRSKV